jgi:trans-aconitate methyltransferase
LQEFPGGNRLDLKEEQILGDQIDQHWYYTSKAKALCTSLEGIHPRLVLDVGAGSGFFSKYLLAQDLVDRAICVDTGYEREWEETAGGKQVSFVRTCGAVDADLVLLMDVLEHVDDDSGLLMEYAEKVPARCRFLVTVPAFNWLWSAHDVFLEHRRRYTAKRTVETIKRAGLRPVDSYYYFGAVLPIAVAVRMAQRLSAHPGEEAASGLQRHSPLVNTVLKGLCTMELPVFRYNHLGGLTVFALAEKK